MSVPRTHRFLNSRRFAMALVLFSTTMTTGAGISTAADVHEVLARTEEQFSTASCGSLAAVFDVRSVQFGNTHSNVRKNMLEGLSGSEEFQRQLDELSLVGDDRRIFTERYVDLYLHRGEQCGVIRPDAPVLSSGFARLFPPPLAALFGSS